MKPGPVKYGKLCWYNVRIQNRWSFIINKYKVVKDHPQRLKTKQIWRPKEAKSKSKSKSNSGDLRCNFTDTIHYHYEAL